MKRKEILDLYLKVTSGIALLLLARSVLSRGGKNLWWLGATLWCFGLVILVNVGYPSFQRFTRNQFLFFFIGLAFMFFSYFPWTYWWIEISLVLVGSLIMIVALVRTYKSTI